MCWRLFLVKLQAFRPATLLKRDSSTRCFPVFKNIYFKEHLRTATSDQTFSSHKYGIRLPHIFDISNEKPSISTEIPSISTEIPSILIENLGFRPKYQVFRIRNFEILGFSHLKFEILVISSEKGFPKKVFRKKCEIPGFQWICISSSIGFRNAKNIRQLSILGNTYGYVDFK